MGAEGEDYTPADGFQWSALPGYATSYQVDALDRRVAALESELGRLRVLNEGLCERIARQSELLSKRAERPEGKARV
jgi:hypothetical protein